MSKTLIAYLVIEALMVDSDSDESAAFLRDEADGLACGLWERLTDEEKASVRRGGAPAATSYERAQALASEIKTLVEKAE